MQTTSTAPAPPVQSAAGPAAVAHRPAGGTITVVAVAAVTALALVFFMISSVTGAAWTDTTDNTGNSWATGEVSLTDDDGGVAMFAVTDMVPGDVVTNSIAVTNESTVPLNVKVYGGNFSQTELSELASNVNLTVGTTAGASDVYTGTLANFSTSRTSFANGTPAIDLAAGATQSYHFEVELDSAAPDSVQNHTAGIDFVWEGQTQ